MILPGSRQRLLTSSSLLPLRSGYWLPGFNDPLESIAGGVDDTIRSGPAQAGNRTGYRGEQRMKSVLRFIRDDSGATAVEYGLIAVAAGLAVAAILPIVSNS